ncbi:glycoside hydrolase family 127 protein [Galbitalea sp. SE-J8]|uniref:glycoside hydrolase family 127 protein n=1 Tax=Galbitalea sp. SE-J8 TaxID=3054952 RepID=UPI00259CE127|nr:beta-L-arabinofuranosidase domain-containing protein [Galbitalea sp. SE-J8]MDM4762004.1 glycoside hydrolase family 127 protein [Galbitalea sp. SE-J8]
MTSIDSTVHAPHATPASVPGPALPVQPRAGTLRPLDLHAVSLHPEGYWGTWQRLNTERMIEHCRYWMERVGWIGNLEAAAAGTLPQARRGREFTDSDVYKLIEAMSWEHGRTGDPDLDAQIRELIAIVGRAQEPDGYINTRFGRPGQAPRYSDLEWGHELYCYGHLLQAAVARCRTSGEDELLAIATRVADHVCDTFGPDGIDSVCGHPEIEVALAEFARLTGQRRYLDQAALFVERRGHGRLAEIEFGREYYQDDIPVRDATVLRGHAVRALYLAAAAVDVAVETDDADLLAAIELQWENTVARRTYLTGGMGSHHQDESFGTDFELPGERAYCETCAGVGSVMLSWRLLLATGRARYADLIERTLHNVIATSPGRDGRSFFYANTLHQRTPGSPVDPAKQSRRAASSQRSAWYEVSCCPTNVARTFATLGCYLATTTDDAVQVHLYTAGSIRADLAAGPVELEVGTDYPYDGAVRIRVVTAPEGDWRLSLRVPAWAEGATLTDDAGTRIAAAAGGYVTLPRALGAGEGVTLELPTEPRFSYPDPRIDDVRGAVAIEAGPLVYCAESFDLGSDESIDDLLVDTSVPARRKGRDGVVVHGRRESPIEHAWPYGPTAAPAPRTDQDIRLVPYSEWGERASGTMRVWIRRADAPAAG